MKKVVAIIAVLVMACVLTASAEDVTYDLKNLSLAELIEVRDLVQQYMWASDEFQSVTVPQGIWVVGEDIPAGKWNVKCAHGEGYMMRQCKIQWGGKPDADGFISLSQRKGEITLNDQENPDYNKGSLTEYVLELVNGDYVSINDAYGKAVFSTYTGKPNLGFK